MSPSIQESSASRRNPFEHYPESMMSQAPGRPRSSAVPAHGAYAAAPPRKNPFAEASPVTPLRAVPLDDRTRAIRRQRYLKKRQFSGLDLLRRGFKLLAVIVLIFVLLPSAVQKKVYRILPFAPATVAVSTPTTPLPVDYDYISSPFGRRWGRQHQGMDFAAPVGEPIYAALAGTVVHSGWEPGYGKSIVIAHANGLQTRYGHCSRLLVKEGAVVFKGGLIARVGSTGHSTGPHLHFEVIVGGVRKNPAWYFTFASTATPHLANAGDED